jgi:hypothetical protein
MAVDINHEAMTMMLAVCTSFLISDFEKIRLFFARLFPPTHQKPKGTRSTGCRDSGIPGHPKKPH